MKFEEAGGLFPDSRTAMLEFLVAEARTYLFVLTKSEDGITRIAVSPAANGEGRIKGLRSWASGENNWLNEPRAFAKL